jgi:uncharacterized protein (TIGR02246 family)
MGLQGMDSDEKAIHALVADWMKATLAGDVDAVLALMTDDVVFLLPGQEPFGKRAFEAASRAAGPMRMSGTSRIEDLQVLGDWAFMRTRIAVDVTPPGEERPIRREGHALTILRREDGRWKIAQDANLLAPVDD